MADDVLIAGAGIGGLATALSLNERGIPVRVYEAVAELKELGVGINLLPHAVRELDEMGLRPALEAAGCSCTELAYYTKRGERIWSEARGIAAGYRWPQISIHRGTLQRVLFEAFLERVGADRLHLSHRVSSSRTDGPQVQLSFEGGRPDVRGRLLIAADGIHSRVRRQFYPDEGPPQWNGAIMWRGMARCPPYLDGHTMIMAGHRDRKFVCYPIGAPAGGGTLQPINFIAERRVAVTERTEQEDWTKEASIDDFAHLFTNWKFDWLDVPAMIRAAENVWVYPMVDRDPLPRWTHGRITLLGDAAHPMYPIGSNGASQAILDARVLTACLLRDGEDPTALARYEQIRRPATAAIVEANRQMGPELPMQLIEDRAPNGFESLEDVVSSDELASIAERYKRVAGFSVAELNERPSLADPNALPEG